MLIQNINSKNWQQKLGNASQIVEDLDDIEQCVTIATSTRKGSIPHDPFWGNGAFDYIDQPENIAVPGIVKETIDCINYCVKRVKIASCKVVASGGSCSILLSWTLKNSDEGRTTEVIIKK